MSESNPSALDRAVDLLLAEMSEKERAELRDTVEADLVELHFPLGLWLMSHLGLRDGGQDLAISQLVRRAWAKVNEADDGAVAAGNHGA